MARLSKHGRELLRVEQEIENPKSDVITWAKYTRCYMSDGTVLSKEDVRFKPTTFEPRGSFYSYGWKIAAKVKQGHTPEEVVATKLRLIQSGESKWKVVSGGPAPVIISQARIMRAIESGDNLGFCKACGSEAYGVEPDARNYRCESCGAMEVYGAEEMLIAG